MTHLVTKSLRFLIEKTDFIEVTVKYKVNNIIFICFYGVNYKHN